VNRWSQLSLTRRERAPTRATPTLDLCPDTGRAAGQKAYAYATVLLRDRYVPQLNTANENPCSSASEQAVDAGFDRRCQQREVLDELLVRQSTDICLQ